MVNPRKYMNGAKGPSAKIFYEAIAEYNNEEEFFTGTLLLNAIPLGVTK